MANAVAQSAGEGATLAVAKPQPTLKELKVAIRGDSYDLLIEYLKHQKQTLESFVEDQIYWTTRDYVSERAWERRQRAEAVAKLQKKRRVLEDKIQEIDEEIESTESGTFWS